MSWKICVFLKSPIVAQLFVLVVVLLGLGSQNLPLLLVQGRTFTKCEFAIELYERQNVSWKFIADWVCIANNASQFNTSYIQVSPPGSNNTNYGIFRVSTEGRRSESLFGTWRPQSPQTCTNDSANCLARCSAFQINHKYWCHDGYELDNGCGLNCSELISDDVSSSIKCAQIIYEKGGKEFESWYNWKPACQSQGQNIKEFLRECDVFPNRQPPEITTPLEQINKTLFIGVENQYLSCEATGNPPPDLSWTYNKTEFPDLFTISEDYAAVAAGGSKNGTTKPTQILKLFFRKVTANMAGEIFSCFAENLAGESEADFTIRVQNAPASQGMDTLLVYSVGIGAPILALALAVLAGIFIYRRFCSKPGPEGGQKGGGGLQYGYGGVPIGLTIKEIQEFHNGNPELLLARTESPVQDLNVYRENINYQPYNRIYEIGDEQIRIDRNKILGSGQFGIVLEGEELKTGTRVAVKTVQPNATKLYIKALLSELKIMIYLGKHDAIVNLIGAKTEELDKGLVYIFVEFCPLGDLENYLRQRKDSFIGLQTTVNYLQSQATRLNTSSHYQTCPFVIDPINTLDLYRWSYQIAAGMEYLASKHVFHGDLATRNILLVNKTCAKITDFGLSKHLYEYATDYVKSADTPLPWRWLALESLLQMSFSIQTDIWSYGVTIWEIFTLGDLPYTAGVQYSIEFIHGLQAGQRLPKPKEASRALYEEIMLKCWSSTSAERPSFETLRNWFRAELEKLESGESSTQQLNYITIAEAE